MMRIATTGVPPAVPRPIVEKLRQLIRRVRVVIALRGVCAIAVVFFVSLLVVMGIDAAAAHFRWSTLVFAAWPRWVMTSLVWAVTVLVGVWFLIRPLAHTFTLTGIARAIEMHHPELHERISSAVELLTSRDAPAFRGSDVLIAALAQEASADAVRVQPKREVSPAPARPYLIAAGAVFAVLGLLFALWPGKTARLFARAVAPHLNLGIDFDLVITPGDKVLAEGDSLRVEVEARNADVDKAEFRRSMGQGSDSGVEMMNVSRPQDRWPHFAITFRQVTEGFRYRVHAGSQTSRYFTVTVVPRPTIRRIDVRYDYPAYTARPADIHRGVEGDIRAVAGTNVTVTAYANTRVDLAELSLCGTTTALESSAIATGQDGTATCTFRARLEPKMKGQWQLKLSSHIDGQTFTSGPDPQGHTIEAIADAEPTARIISPENARLRLKASDSLPIVYAVGDDFGLSRTELLVKVGDQPVAPMPLALPGEGNKVGRIFVGKTALDLAALKLEKAGQVTFQLRALDNLPASFLPGVSGPQQGLSDIYTITIDVKAPSYQEQMALAEELLIRQALQSVLKDLKEARAESDPLRKALEKIAEVQANLRKEKPLQKEKTEALSEAQVKRVDVIRKKLTSADATVHDLIQQISGGTYAALAEKLTALSSNHVSVAENYASQIKLVEELLQRADLAKKTDFHIWHAIEIVEELLKEFDAMAALMRRADELAELAQRQNELADAKAEMEQSTADADAMSEKDWKKAQEEVAGNMAEMVKKTPGALAAALKADQKDAQTLADKARELAKDQRNLAEDAKRAADMDKTDSELKKLAAEQAELAKQTEGKSLPEPAKPMAAAAEDIKSAQLRDAIKKQEKAEAGLKDTSEKAKETAGQAAKESQKASSLAERAEQVAREQKDLAGKAKAATEAKEAQALTGTQKQVAQKAEQVAKQAESAGEAAKQAAKQGNPSPKMQEAAKAMESGKPAEAAKAAAEAAEQAGELAKALKKAAQNPAAQAAEKTGENAAEQGRKQAELRKKTEELAQKREALAAAQKGNELARLAAEQADVAKKAAEMVDRVKATAPQPDNVETDAAAAAQKAAEEIKKPDVPAAAKDARQAADKLGDLAQRLEGKHPAGEKSSGEKSSGEKSSGEKSSGEKSSGEKSSGEKSSGEKSSGEKSSGEKSSGEKSSGQPSPQVSGSTAQEPDQVAAQKPSGERAKLAQDAGQLAKRQDQLAKEMAALAGNRLTEAAAQRQKQLAEKTEDLAKDVRTIQDHAEELIPDAGARREAENAAAELGKAEQAQGKAEQALSKGQASEATAPAQAAASALAQAAGALERLGRALAEAAGKATPGEPSETAGQTAEAYDAVAEAAMTAQASAAEKAAAMLSALAQAAAESAASAAGAEPGQQPGQQPGKQGMQPGQPSQSLTSKVGVGMVMANLTPQQLEKLGITLQDWARLPGKLRDEVLQAAGDDSPGEYRDLVKRYFQEIAKRGGAKGKIKNGASDKKN